MLTKIKSLEIFFFIIIDNNLNPCDDNLCLSYLKKRHLKKTNHYYKNELFLTNTDRLVKTSTNLEHNDCLQFILY